jgi:hypothetical protein
MTFAFVLQDYAFAIAIISVVSIISTLIETRAVRASFVHLNVYPFADIESALYAEC